MTFLQHVAEGWRPMTLVAADDKGRPSYFSKHQSMSRELAGALVGVIEDQSLPFQGTRRRSRKRIPIVKTNAKIAMTMRPTKTTSVARKLAADMIM